MEWIKCSERMPKSGETVLFTSQGRVLAGSWDDGRYLKRPIGRWKWTGRIYGNPVTHWMPLPEPPSE